MILIIQVLAITLPMDGGNGVFQKGERVLLGAINIWNIV